MLNKRSHTQHTIIITTLFLLVMASNLIARERERVSERDFGILQDKAAQM